MENKEILEIIEENKSIIDQKIENYFKEDSLINEAMVYGAGAGKRVRANLYLQSKKMFSGKLDQNDYDLAMAIEFIHSYSLAHDDLPAMDDDDYRRGLPSLHKKYGEDLAILAGDGLLNEAAFILTELGLKDEAYLKAARYILERSSKRGMIEGQVLDLRRGACYDLSYLLEVYDKKTSDLFKAACVSAAIVSKVSDEDIGKIESYAKNLGLAFQIQDDLLEESFKDELNILNILSKSEAVDLLKEINDKAEDSIKDFKGNDFLRGLIRTLSKRSY